MDKFDRIHKLLEHKRPGLSKAATRIRVLGMAARPAAERDEHCASSESIFAGKANTTAVLRLSTARTGSKPQRVPDRRALRTAHPLPRSLTFCEP